MKKKLFDRENIEVTLDSFEGPLELLLHLIQQSKIEIAEIFISDVTSQYLEYMQDVGYLDMDKASDFLDMAATLVLIKSRSLMPNSRIETAEDEIDPEEQLVRQLNEYQKVKKASQALEEKLEEGSRIFTRLPEELLDTKYVFALDNISSDNLFEALAMLILREEKERKFNRVRVVELDEYSIVDSIINVERKLKIRKKAEFTELFPRDGGRIGIIVTFMAILELFSKQKIKITQGEGFGMLYVEGVEFI